MFALTLLVSILLKGTLVIFLVALLCGILARSWFNQQRIGRARLAGRFAFAASSLLAALYLAMALLSLSAINLLFAALWCFFAWRDLRFLRQIGGG